MLRRRTPTAALAETLSPAPTAQTTNPKPALFHFTPSKFGLDGLTRSIELDARAHGIAVSVLHPGNIDTDIWNNMGDMAALKGMVPLPDVAEPACHPRGYSPYLSDG